MRTVRALIIAPDGVSEVKQILVKLADLQGIVGGPIECATLSSCHFYFDEEGKHKGLPVNQVATRLAVGLGWRPLSGDVLCGTVVVLGNHPRGKEADIPQEVIDRQMEIEVLAMEVATQGWPSWLRGPAAQITPSFELGRLVMTSGVQATLTELAGADLVHAVASALIDRHATGDWGVVDEEDSEANRNAIRDGEQIFSAYLLSPTGPKVYVITEADRSVTTLMLVTEY